MILETGLSASLFGLWVWRIIGSAPQFDIFTQESNFVSSVIECYFNLCKNTYMKIIL